MAPTNKKSGKAKPKKSTASSSSTPQPAIATTPAPAPPTLDTQPSLSSATTVLPSSSNLIDFETFLDLADVDNIIQFCDAVASTQEGRNLKKLWDRAFGAGLEAGQTEEWRRGEEDRRKAYLDGKARGIEEAQAKAMDEKFNIYNLASEKGRTEEREEWTSAGHGPHCAVPVAILSDEGTQTESAPSTIQTPATTCNANIQTFCPLVDTSTQTSTATDFESPMELEDLDNLCARAAAASSDVPLGAIWKQAYKSGSDNCSRMVNNVDVNELFNQGQILGILNERQEWLTLGHSQDCFTVKSPSTCDTGTQIDFETVNPVTQTLLSSTDASTQTSIDADPLNNPESIDILCAFSATAPSTNPLGLVWQRAYEAGTQAKGPSNQAAPLYTDTSMQTTSSSQVTISTRTLESSLPPPSQREIANPTRLDWAEDVESLPISLSPPPPPCRQPRDLSVLRSSSPSPFSSLQRRAKRPLYIPPRQSHRRHAPFNSDFPHPPSERHRDPHLFARSRPKPLSCRPTQEQTLEKEAPRLNWESDPRLSDLSRALKALGWSLTP